MPGSDSCQRLGEAILGVLGLLVLGCLGVNTTHLIWLHLRPLLQGLLLFRIPKTDILSKSAAPPARPCQPPPVPGAPSAPRGPPSPMQTGRRLQAGPHLSCWRPPAHGPQGMEMAEPWARPKARLAPAHRAHVYVWPLPDSPAWTPPSHSLGNAPAGWQKDSNEEGVSVHPPSPTFASWNREGSGVLH